MIAVMAATGMTGNEIVAESLPGRPGHPSNFFSDKHIGSNTTTGREPERRLSQLLDTWQLAQRRRKRSRKIEFFEEMQEESTIRGKRWPSSLSWHQRVSHFLFFTFGAVVVLAAVLWSAGVVAYAFASGRSPWEVLTWMNPSIAPLELSLKASFLILVTFLAAAFILRSFSATRNFPLFSFLMLFPKGRYWKWVWRLLSKHYGFLRGDGMRQAFDLLFRERINTRAASLGRIELARPFSTLTFEEFEELFEVPIKIVASDLWSGKPIVFDRHEYGDYRVFDAVRASTAFPLAFEPVIARSKRDGDGKEAKDKIAHVLVDGGLSSNSPAFLFKRESDFSRIPTIAFQLNYSYPGPYYPEDLLAYFNSLTRTAVGAGDTIIQGLVPRMHVVSVSGLEEYGVLDGDLSQKALLRLFELGRARQDELVRIWKICRIERKDGGEPKSELGPVMESIRALLDRYGGARVSTAVGLWVPDDHRGRRWRLLYKDGNHPELEIGRMFGFHPPEEPASPHANVAASAPSTEDMVHQVHALPAGACAATAHHALFTREFAAKNVGTAGYAMALPVPSYTLEPDTWTRGRDVVAVLSMVAMWGNGGPVNPTLTASSNATIGEPMDFACGWFGVPDGHDPNEELTLDSELGKELGRWKIVVSRLMAA